MPRKISGKGAIYWSNLCIASAQVFLGIAGATLFTNPSLDFGTIIIVILNIILALSCAVTGRKVIG